MNQLFVQFAFARAYVRCTIRSERGASLVEYALLLVFIVLAAIGGLEFLGQNTTKPYSNAASGLG